MLWLRLDGLLREACHRVGQRPDPLVLSRNDGFIYLLKARALLYRAPNELNERRKS
jgi:hypothetical protein